MRSTATVFGVLALLVGCAEEAPVSEAAPSEPTPAAEVSLGAAFYGLTVIDCQSEATACFEENVKSGKRRPLKCTAQLSSCLADVGLQAAGDVAAEAIETVACGTDGLGCLGGAESVRDAVSCHQEVEGCVIERVEAVSGIKLPSTGKVIEAAAGVVEHTVGTAVTLVDGTAHVAGEVVKGTAHVAGEVVKGTAHVAGEVVKGTVETAVHVTGHAVEAAAGVLEATGDTVAHVAGHTIGAAVNVIEGTTEATLGVVAGLAGGFSKLAECSLASQKCWRETRDFPGCQKAYSSCLKAK